MLRRLKSPYVAVTLIFTCLYTAMFGIMPSMNDDIWFRSYLLQFVNDPTWDNLCDGMAENFKFRSVYDNIRIPNLVLPLFVIINRWIPAVVLGCAVGLILWLGGKVTGTWRKSPAGFAAWVIGFFYLPPWACFMFGIAYATNYIISTLLVLICCTLYFKEKTSVWVLFCIGLLTGLWHELALATIVGGVCLLMLFDSSYRNRRSAALLCGCLLALSVYFTASATSRRIGNEFNLWEFMHFTSGIFYAIWFYLFIIVATVLLVKKNTRERLWNPLFIFVSGGACAGWCVERIFSSNERASWMMLVFITLGFSIIVRTFIRSTKVSTRISAVVLMLCILQNVACLPWFVRLRHEQEAAVALVRANPGRQGLFTPMTLPTEQPLYLLGRPNFNSYILFGFPQFQVVPERLSDFSPEKAVPIGMDSCEAYLYKGLIVLPHQRFARVNRHCYIRYGTAFPRLTSCSITPFTTEAGKFVVVRTPIPLNLILFNEITGFSLGKRTFDNPLDYLYDIRYAAD